MKGSQKLFILLLSAGFGWGGITSSAETPNAEAAAPVQVSGIYPHLAMFNQENECGTGAVVPWADRLWVITYGPHLPFGSSDKLYEITPALEQITRSDSVGGTHANRFIHRGSQQLIIGPYFIDRARKIRVIAPSLMPGRLTGTARHLSRPENKVYFATMEEGLYEVDVRSLEVTGLIKDGNAAQPGQTREKHPARLESNLPGYHGKGLYSGQGRLVYANNGEPGAGGQSPLTIASGALAEWRSNGDWQLVRRNQFTEVSGPGGISGNTRPGKDPVWSIGWDARSLLLMLLDGGSWHVYRLPKGSHAYDGAHGWHTEWPRIRDIGERDLLMTMHGTFWRFPQRLDAGHSAGIVPRSTYLKVIGDFCRWNDRVVFGCDDTAKAEFTNRRKAKGSLAGPARSQSNLWFVEPGRLDQLGPALGRGAVWLNENVSADTASDPFLFAGYDHRSLHLAHRGPEPVTITLQVDAKGNGQWKRLRDILVPANGNAWTEFVPSEQGAWIRLVSDRNCVKATAFFHYRNLDNRAGQASAAFASLADTRTDAMHGGLLLVRSGEREVLRFAAAGSSGDLGCYDLDGELRLRPVRDPAALHWMKANASVPTNVLTVDDASVLFVDEKGRWRLPKGDRTLNHWGGTSALFRPRVDREVCTERDLFNAHGTFYELPAEGSGGLAKIRPIATHNRRVVDYASYRGLLVLSGLSADPTAIDPHVVRSEDGKCALWVGAVDDLWQLGKPRGCGGPWCNAAARAGELSDPYLMTGYDRKRLELSHTSGELVSFRLELDISGEGDWVVYRDFAVQPGAPLVHVFPDSLAAYWARVSVDKPAVVSAQFIYE